MFKHNVNKLNLLRNEAFYILTEEEKTIQFFVPTFRDYIEDENLTLFFSARDLKWEEVNLNRSFENYYELLLFMAFNDLYSGPIVKTIYKFIPQAKILNTGIYIEEYKLSYEEFAFITDVWLVSMGAKKLDEIITHAESDEELHPIMKKIKESEEKVRRIKKQKENQKDNGDFSLDKLMIAVIKEFGLSMKEVWDSNLYTLMWYYEYALRYGNYRVNSIAFGNGLIKKHKYFIE
jgi:hypothetical protein